MQKVFYRHLHREVDSGENDLVLTISRLGFVDDEQGGGNAGSIK